MVSTAFPLSSVSCSCKQPKLRAECGNREFAAKSEVQTACIKPALEGKGALWHWALSPVGSELTLGSWCQNGIELLDAQLVLENQRIGESIRTISRKFCNPTPLSPAATASLVSKPPTVCGTEFPRLLGSGLGRRLCSDTDKGASSCSGCRFHTDISGWEVNGLNGQLWSKSQENKQVNYIAKVILEQVKGKRPVTSLVGTTLIKTALQQCRCSKYCLIQTEKMPSPPRNFHIHYKPASGSGLGTANTDA